MISILILFATAYLYSFWANRPKNGPIQSSNYLSVETTSTIKGFFVVLIFASHFSSYVQYQTFYDTSLKNVCSFLGQLIVIPFLFYSGYGVYESFKKKGESYIHNFPKRRIFKVLLHFDLAVLIYFIINQITGIDYPLQQTLLSLIAWEDIGNSNWFIFAILLTYLFTYIAFSITTKPLKGIGIITFLALSYIVILYFAKKGEPWWWNTVISYPMGMLFSYYKIQIESTCFKSKRISIILLTSILTLFILLKVTSIPIYIFQTLSLSILFTMFLPLWSWFMPTRNQILIWLGKNVFGVYILQRIPMNLLKDTPISDNVYLYFSLCIIITITLTIVFQKATDWIDFKLKI